MTFLQTIKDRFGSPGHFISTVRLGEFEKMIKRSYREAGEAREHSLSLLTYLSTTDDPHNALREISAKSFQRVRSGSLKEHALLLCSSAREMAEQKVDLVREGVWKLFSPYGQFDQLLRDNIKVYSLKGPLSTDNMGQHALGLSLVSLSRSLACYQSHRELILKCCSAELADYINATAHHEAAHQITDGYLIPNNPFVLPLDIASRMRPILRFYDPRVNKLTYPRSREEVCELVSYAAALAVNTSCIPDLIEDALDGNEQHPPEYRLSHAMTLSAAFYYAAKNGKADEFARSANLANEDLITSTAQVIQLLGKEGAEYIAQKFYKHARVALVIARSDFYNQRRKELRDDSF